MFKLQRPVLLVLLDFVMPYFFLQNTPRPRLEFDIDMGTIHQMVNEKEEMETVL